MTTPTYTPRAGSLASQVIGFFRHNPDEELLLDDITDKFDATRGNIHTLLADAVKADLLVRYRNADGFVLDVLKKWNGKSSCKWDSTIEAIEGKLSKGE